MASFDLLQCFCYSKERKIKISNYWHEFYCSSLYCAFPLLNANMRTFNLYVESLKWYNLYFLAHACICISFLSEQWKCCKKKKKTSVFFYLTSFLIHTHSTTTFYLQPTEWVRTEREKELRVAFSLSFLQCHHFQHEWLCNMGTRVS